MIDKLNYFKRANFFTGLMASSKFWNDLQDYHLQKEQFYNLVFHGYGIAPDVMEELKVTSAKETSNFKIIIGPGFAIDKMGRGIFLYEPQAKIIDYKKYKLPVTVYVVIRYNEQLDDYYQSRENPEFQGYQKKMETALIEITTHLPDNVNDFECARIYLEEDENGEIKNISDPEDISNPKANEIDTRFVIYSTIARRGLPPYLKKYIISVLDNTKKAAAMVNESLNFFGLRELQTICLSAKMLVQCGDVNLEDIINIINPLYEINNNIAQEMFEFERSKEKNQFSSVVEMFDNFRTKVYEMGDLIKYYDHNLDTINKLLNCQEEVTNSIKNIIVVEKTRFEDIAFISYDLPGILIIEDDRYTLVDQLDFNDFNTETRNHFSMTNNKDTSSAKQTFLYPDGVEVKDSIKTYIGGEVTFTIKNLTKERELVMIRRTDVFYGNYKVNVYLDDQEKGQLVIDGADSKNRWRNLYFIFGEDSIIDRSVKITFKMEENGRDNFGKMWFYQKS
ncbi:MAG: hypothetical protein SVR08_11295 [Spirochaetota bacterium]|nr:hypothetical protein [Spirochaetota bacterium]